MDEKAIIKIKNLTRHYKTGEVVVKALNSVSFEIKKGEFIAIMGASGSGKTTMLRILGLLDKPTEGEYTINNLDVVECLHFISYGREIKKRIYYYC